MEITLREEMVLKTLDALGISYTRKIHPPVFSIEESSKYSAELEGAHCKNLFLRNKKGNRHYLVVIEQTKTADIKTLTQRLHEDRLSFASGERLMRYLGLETGAVSPFGLINDTQKAVKVIIDEELRSASQIYFHPNVNTATVGLSFIDFEMFLQYCGNEVRYLSVE